MDDPCIEVGYKSGNDERIESRWSVSHYQEKVDDAHGFRILSVWLDYCWLDHAPPFEKVTSDWQWVSATRRLRIFDHERYQAQGRQLIGLD
jgi:hypothetical protein